MRFAAVLLVVASGCGGGQSAAIDAPAGTDSPASSDASPADGIAPSDATTDSSSSTGDAASDSSTTPDSSTSSDAAPDAPPDAGIDAMPDAAPDAPPDAPPDAAPDAPPDAAPDAPPSDGGIPPCTPATWCIETPPIGPTILASVWAVSAGDVFAVGDGGTILRRTNNGWTQLASGTTQNLRAVWAASSTDAWAVGDAGTMLRWNGTTWSPVPGFTDDFKAVWGSSATDVWFASFGTVRHWDGQAFTSQTVTGNVFAISGTGPNDVWVTGENASVDHFTGTWTFGIKPLATQTTYFGIHAISTTNVFAAGFLPNKETFQFDGTTWTARKATGVVFVGFHSTSDTDLWGVGNNAVGHWNGSAWSLEAPAGQTVQLLDVTGVANHVWVVGTDSTILHRN